MTLPRLIFPVCGQTRKHSGRLYHLSFSFVNSRSLQNCNNWQDKFLSAVRPTVTRSIDESYRDQ
ncbi:MAG: hypothetical protein DME55_05295 [Verrucomicrobia bacterium]|nr:MAG: hypothetical protein DME55_05295 [Verrucomicrobiota bacterium]